MSTIEFLHHIRTLELASAISEMPITSADPLNKMTILEIGSGTGQQAKILTESGFNVIALDLATSAYKNQRVFPITEYDGKIIPCQDSSIDILFSSNVLEHIEDIDAFLKETHRVLTPQGVAIHILPTSSCRFWSLIAHYGWLMKKLAAFIPMRHNKETHRTPNLDKIRENKILKVLFPSRHGERGNSLTEIFYYSEYWWKNKFLSSQFEIQKISTNGIFYSMANFLQFKLSIKKRLWLSAYFGSSCKIYKLKKSSR
jgi:ubiquinone/menaquinone biosynthesis C-methylase UbiE